MTDTIEFTTPPEDSGSSVSGHFVMRNAGHMVPRDGEETAIDPVTGSFVMADDASGATPDADDHLFLPSPAIEGDLPDILIYEPPDKNLDGFEPLSELTTDQPDVADDGSGQVVGHYTQIVWAE